MRRRHRRKNNQRKIIIFSLIGLLFIMVVGYSAFQTNLNLNAEATIVCNTSCQLKKKVVASGDGLYASTYEEGRYIYRGSNPDNYITFNNETWRIMSVEQDGTLKIRRATALTSLDWDSSGNRSYSSSTYCKNANGGYGNCCNAWAATDNLTGSPLPTYTQYYPNGNTSDSTKHSGTVTQDASLNTYLNETYYNTLSDEAKSYVVEGTFDVSFSGNTSDTEDMATNIEQAKRYQWKGKVALMTILEWMQTTSNTTCTSLNVAYKSGSTGYCNSNNWMFSSTQEWTLSPNLSAYDYSYTAGVISVTSGGSFGGYYASSGNPVRPVLYLTSNITLSGSGSSSDPYIIDS